MHLPIFTFTFIFTLALSSTLIFHVALTHAIAVPNPALTPQDLFPDRVQGRIVQRGGVQALQDRQALDIDPPRSDGLIPFAGGGPVIGKFVKPSFTPGPSDNVLPFPNSVELRRRGGTTHGHLNHTSSNAFCPYPGTAYCCNLNPGTGGTLCKWNGDGHLAGCELVTGGESVCCGSLGCKGMEGLREPIGTV